MCEMLWCDPQEAPGRGPSKRGVGIGFGPDVTKRWTDLNEVTAVIRSHEVQQGGYSVTHAGRLITVFSAPNYVSRPHCIRAVLRMGKDANVTRSRGSLTHRSTKLGTLGPSGRSRRTARWDSRCSGSRRTRTTSNRCNTRRTWASRPGYRPVREMEYIASLACLSGVLGVWMRVWGRGWTSRADPGGGEVWRAGQGRDRRLPAEKARSSFAPPSAQRPRPANRTRPTLPSSDPLPPPVPDPSSSPTPRARPRSFTLPPLHHQPMSPLRHLGALACLAAAAAAGSGSSLGLPA